MCFRRQASACAILLAPGPLWAGGFIGQGAGLAAALRAVISDVVEGVYSKRIPVIVGFVDRAYVRLQGLSAQANPGRLLHFCEQQDNHHCTGCSSVPVLLQPPHDQFYMIKKSDLYTLDKVANKSSCDQLSLA